MKSKSLVQKANTKGQKTNDKYKKIKYKLYPVAYPKIYPFIRLMRGARILEVPVSLLFSQVHNIDEVKSVTEEWLSFYRKRKDVPVSSLKEHEDMIQFCVDSSKGSIDAYLESWEYVYKSRNIAPPYTREERVRRRRDFVQRAIKKGVPRHLRRDPCRVDRFERDHFNLFDGHHRVALANFFRIDYLNIECPPDIYEKFLKRKTVSIEKLIDRRLKHNRQIDQPVDIHGYYHLNVERNCKNRLDMMRRWLGGDVKGCSTLLDAGSRFGYFCHHFQRQGLQTFGIEPDPERVEIASALNEACGLKSEFAQIGLEDFTGKSCDIVMAFSVVRHLVDKMRLLSYAEAADKLGKFTNKYLFWESKQNSSREKEEILSNGNFSQYLKLGNSYDTGKMREFGVFVK